MKKSLPWVKVYVNMFGEGAIAALDAEPQANDYFCIWFKLLCLAGKQSYHGRLMITDDIPYTPETLASYFRRKPSLVKKSLEKFKEYGLISIENGVILINDWGQFQGSEKEAERLEKHNQSQQKYLAKKNTEMISKANQIDALETESESNIETNIYTEGEGEPKNKPLPPPPTREEVVLHCQQMGYRFNPQRFYNYCERDGWYENGKLIDWKFKAANWDAGEWNKNKIPGTFTETTEIDRSGDDDSELYFKGKH